MKVDGTDDGEQGNETQVQYLMVGNLRIIKELAVVDEFAEVVSQTLDVVGIEKITGCKPIGTMRPTRDAKNVFTLTRG